MRQSQDQLCGPWANSWGPVPCVPGLEMSGMSGMGLRIKPGIIAIILWWQCVYSIYWYDLTSSATSFYLSEKLLEYQVTGSHMQHCWGSGKGSANICILADRCNEGTKFNVNWIVIENKSNTNLTRNEIYEPREKLNQESGMKGLIFCAEYQRSPSDQIKSTKQ